MCLRPDIPTTTLAPSLVSRRAEVGRRVRIAFARLAGGTLSASEHKLEKSAAPGVRQDVHRRHAKERSAMDAMKLAKYREDEKKINNNIP